jgi:hypothetical protein
VLRRHVQRRIPLEVARICIEIAVRQDEPRDLNVPSNRSGVQNRRPKRVPRSRVQPQIQNEESEDLDVPEAGGQV